MSVRVTLVEGPLPEAAPHAGCGGGAVVRFEGRVRADEDGRPIDALEYEAYRPMADRQLESLAREALESFGLLGVQVEHSEGTVPVGDCSFRLVVESPHRKEALAAVDWFVDRLKRDVPIWKRATPATRPVRPSAGSVAPRAAGREPHA